MATNANEDCVPRPVADEPIGDCCICQRPVLLNHASAWFPNLPGVPVAHAVCVSSSRVLPPASAEAQS